MGFGRIGMPELILILAIALVIFGPSKLPEIGKSLGKALKEFKAGSSEESSKEESSKEESSKEESSEKEEADEKEDK